MDNQERFLTAEQVAEMMQVKVITVYRMVRRGELPAIRFGKSYRFSRHKLMQALEKMKTHD